MPTHEEFRLRALAKLVGATLYGDSVIFKNAELVGFWHAAYEKGREDATSPRGEVDDDR